MTVIAEYAVTGMTCQHCVAAVTDEVSALPGVTAVAVDLKPEGRSVVQITSAGVDRAAVVAAAVDEAGTPDRLTARPHPSARVNRASASSNVDGCLQNAHRTYGSRVGVIAQGAQGNRHNPGVLGDPVAELGAEANRRR